MYDQLHAAGPFHRVVLPGGLPALAVTGHAEVRSAARDGRLVHDPRRVVGAGHGIASRRYPLDGVSASRHVLSADAADHVRLRALLRPFFTPEAIARHAPVVRRSVGRALDRFAEHGGGDLVAHLARPVATRTVAHLLGQSVEEAKTLVGLSLRLSSCTDPQEESMVAATAAMSKALAALVARARRRPGDDLATALVAAYRRGLMSGDELLGMLSFVVFAAMDSTLAVIPAGAVHLLDEAHSEVRQALAAGLGDEDLVIEETLRLAAPFTYGVWRFAAEPMTLGGHQLDVGHLVVLCFPAANVDPKAWPSAWQLRPGRPGAGRHLSFGHGPHFCPGAGLGRLQVRTALVELFRRFPELRLGVAAHRLSGGANVARHFSSVPVLTNGPDGGGKAAEPVSEAGTPGVRA
ncbi:cytochrome P450 [Streptomyces sp. NPDC047028]|uniref:cytochrome P450 n=1 Tax=Streptomyces sp. NPDC047028 TaxID=3155793 RepID=UPI00340504B4